MHVHWYAVSVLHNALGGGITRLAPACKQACPPFPAMQNNLLQMAHNRRLRFYKRLHACVLVDTRHLGHLMLKWLMQARRAAAVVTVFSRLPRRSRELLCIEAATHLNPLCPRKLYTCSAACEEWHGHATP